jgi:hypothetical protein
LSNSNTYAHHPKHTHTHIHTHTPHATRHTHAHTHTQAFVEDALILGVPLLRCLDAPSFDPTYPFLDGPAARSVPPPSRIASIS